MEPEVTTPPPPRNRVRFLVFVNVLALVGGIGGFLLLLWSPFLDAPSAKILDLVYANKPLLVLLAVSPVFGTLLVGYGYMRRAMERRSREQREPPVPPTPQ